jgi:hypothetical protein
MAGGCVSDDDPAHAPSGPELVAHCKPVLPGLRNSYFLKVLLATTALVAAAVPAAAQTATWTGTNSFNWFDAGNWSPAAVPTAVDAAVINTTNPNFPVISGGNAVAGSVNVGGVFDPITQTTTSGDGVLFILTASSLTTSGGALLGDTIAPAIIRSARSMSPA